MPRLVIESTLLMLLILIVRPALGVETICFQGDDDVERTVVGEILIEAQDGGVMLQADDGRIWMIQPKQLIERQTNDQALTPLDEDQIEERLLEELQDGFAIYRTQHYVVAYNCSENTITFVTEIGITCAWI